MIKVRIGETERDLEESDERWINQQINRRRDDGHDVCVRVVIEKGDINMTLSTPNCSHGSGYFHPNDKERLVIDLWEKRGLNKKNFSGGNLISFLKQLKI